MNLRSIFKPISIAILVFGMGHAVFAMEKSKLQDLLLSFAAATGDLASVENTLKAGANINCRDVLGWTPLHVASVWNHPEIAKLLLDRGADINYADKNGRTPLYIASVYNHPDVAKLLLERDADIYCVDNDGKTAFAIAKQFNRSKISELITEEAKKREIELNKNRLIFALNRHFKYNLESVLPFIGKRK